MLVPEQSYHMAESEPRNDRLQFIDLLFNFALKKMSHEIL